MEPQMDDATMLEAYDSLIQWENPSPSQFPDPKFTYNPVLLSQTFPFEKLTSQYPSPVSNSSPPSPFGYSYSSPPSIRSQTPPLSLDNLEPIPSFFEPPSSSPQSRTPTIKPEFSPPPPPSSHPRSLSSVKLHISKNISNSKVQKRKAPPSPTAIERRRQQNRASQMAFRERTKKLVDDLKKQLEDSETEKLMLKRALDQFLRAQYVRT